MIVSTRFIVLVLAVARLFLSEMVKAVVPGPPVSNHRFSLDRGNSVISKENAKLLGRNDILKMSRAPRKLNHAVVFAIKNRNLKELESKLVDISQPSGENYGKHLSTAEVTSITSNQISYEEVVNFLEAHEITVVKTSRNNLFITAEAPISKWEEVFGNEFHLFKQTDLADVHLVRAEEYSLPDVLVPHVEAVLNVVQFPGAGFLRKNAKSTRFEVRSIETDIVTPALLNGLYSIRSNEGHVNATQAVTAVLDEMLSTADLTRFQQKFNLPLDSVSNIGGHISTECTTPEDCTLPNLNVQYLMATSQDSPTTFMYWSGTDFWLDWITAVAEMTDPPKVMTITHSQYEHEISPSIANLFNIEAMKLSLAGTTIVVAAGDDGAAGPGARNDPLQCGYFPQFPATSPYVTSVGATMGPESGSAEIACQSNQGGEITSGGGFSALFSAPDYQTAATSGYCSQLCTTTPSASPSQSPTRSPSQSPTRSPSQSPSVSPSRAPTTSPSMVPTCSPTANPTTFQPSISRTPTAKPTTRIPSIAPTRSFNPTTRIPTAAPTTSNAPTRSFAPTLGDSQINWFESPTVMNKSPAAATRVMSADGSTVFVTTTEVVYVSRDYGHSYSKVDVGGATEDFIGLACSATCEYCFIVEAVGKSAKRSSDFGVSWQPIDLSAITKQKTDGPSRAVSSQDGRNVILLGKFLIVSSDFGVTFSKLDTPSSIEDYPNTEFGPEKAYISMDRSDRLYFSYYVPTFWPWVPDVGVLFKSIDFGATWVEMSTPVGSWRYPQMSFDLSGLNGFSTVIKSGGYTTSIFSRDGGATWTEPEFVSADVIGLSMCQDHATGRHVTVGGNNMHEVYSSRDFGETFYLNRPTVATAAQKHRSIACSYDGRFVVTGADDASYYGVRVVPTAKPTPAPSISPSASPTKSRKPSAEPTTLFPVISTAPTVTFSPSVRPTSAIPTFLPSVSYHPTKTSKPSWSPNVFPSYTSTPTSYTAGYLRWDRAQSDTHAPGQSGIITNVVMSADGSTILHYSSMANTVLLISRDYGETYTTNDYNTSPTDLTVDINVFFGLSCSATCEYCYAVHISGLKARRSYDYGVTWQPISLDTITKQAYPSFPCMSVTSQDGSTVIFLSTFMAISTDYGITVNKLLPPPSLDPDTVYISGRSFISMDRSDRLFFSHLVSNVGLLFKSLDFGTTWVQMTTPASNYLYTTVSFDLSGVHGVAAVTTFTGGYKTLFSSDSGASWSTSSLSTVGYKVCQDHATGRYVNVIGGSSTNDNAQKEVYSSVDFGATFTANTPNTTSVTLPIFFQYGLACSYDGTHVVTYISNLAWNGKRELIARRLTEQNQPQNQPQSPPVSSNSKHMQIQSTCIERPNEHTCVGRGYPDLAVLGHNYQTISNNQTITVSSTSASASVVAGMISLVNARRLKAGKSTLGWLNPALYANYARFANDITSGNNSCAAGGEVCCSAGYTAGTGWDPVTGLGSVNFTGFSNVLAALGNRPYVPTHLPTRRPTSPTHTPSIRPSRQPSFKPTFKPTAEPSVSLEPSREPSLEPSQSPV